MRLRAVAALLLLFTTGACVNQAEPAPPLPSAAPPPVTPDAVVSVDAGGSRSAFNNPANYQNQADHSQNLTAWQTDALKRIKPEVVRAWVSPQRYYDLRSRSYRFDYTAPNGGSLYRYLDQAVSYGRKLFLNFNQCDQSIMEASAPATCAEALYQGIRHYKQRYPTLEYVELFNEPDRDWAEPANTPRKMTPQVYYGWYRLGYEAVNKVNQEFAAAVPIKFGGPVTYFFNTGYLKAFLDLYRADPNPAKRLDFLAYHQYKARANPTAVAAEASTIRGWLRERGLDPGIKAFVTEYGVFPGSNEGTAYDADLLTHAAAMSVLGGYYATSGLDMPMHWVIDHPSNTRKSMFPDGQDQAVHPYFNVVRMQRLLKGDLVESRSDRLSAEGIGVTSLATADSTGVAVMVTNYQWTNPAAPTYLVGIDLKGMPTGKVKVYLIDGHPAETELSLVDARVDRAGDTTRVLIGMKPNAIALVVVERA